MEDIYKEFTEAEKQTLTNMFYDSSITSNINFNNIYVQNTRIWLVIFENYLLKQQKKLIISSTKYYYYQDDLDNAFPTNEEETERILEPFRTIPSKDKLQIKFVDTSTGSKIYEYASKLCKADKNYIDKPTLAVALTEHSKHKVKIVQQDNIVWILSNKFSEKFVNNALALIPYLFSITELMSDENIKQCCKAVTKKESIKPYFKDTFESLALIQRQKTITTIKKILNSKTERQIQKLDSDIQRYRSNIEDLEERLVNYYTQLDQILTTKLGYESKTSIEDDTVNDLLDFVDRNKYIQEITTIPDRYYTNQKHLLFNICAPINIYEAEPLERQLDNLKEAYPKYTKIIKAFKRIFIDEELQMICQTFVRVDLASLEISAQRESVGKSYSDFIRLPQPHLTRFNCWGDNKNGIISALKDCDLLTALNNIVIATQNVNFTDTTVLRNWFEDIYNSNHLYNLPTCISKVDGNLWSIKDVVDQINREEPEVIAYPKLTDEIPNF